MECLLPASAIGGSGGGDSGLLRVGTWGGDGRMISMSPWREGVYPAGTWGRRSGASSLYSADGVSSEDGD